MWTKRNWVPMVQCTILSVVLITGCCDRKGLDQYEGAAQLQEAPKPMKSVSKEDLQKYTNQLITLGAVFEKHQVRPQSSYSNEKEAFLEVRRVGEHAKTLSDAEKASLKQSIFEAIGAEFPLNISVYTINEQSGMTGKITAINEKGSFLVVSSDKFIGQDNKMPDAAWYTMSDDARIEFEGKKLQSNEVQIGDTVKVWAEGMMLTSYPGQTMGLRLEIIAHGNGAGDASGKVTGVVTTGEGVNVERIIEIDGVKYKLLPFAQLRKESGPAQFSDITVGKLVKIWFAGYDFGSEKFVTKVAVDS
ncbi:DUF3221 domain-containing protein [Paenibacillus sp. 2RAB27]|uniref:DUF3221 domain-containing protein n=1 Tax=Paenibacillus sp. 2RAB27 TaxID=3232991 RepID=UPI003F9A2000